MKIQSPVKLLGFTSVFLFAVISMMHVSAQTPLDMNGNSSDRGGGIVGNGMVEDESLLAEEVDENGQPIDPKKKSKKKDKKKLKASQDTKAKAGTTDASEVSALDSKKAPVKKLSKTLKKKKAVKINEEVEAMTKSSGASDESLTTTTTIEKTSSAKE